jgi:hypothetical protein
VWILEGLELSCSSKDTFDGGTEELESEEDCEDIERATNHEDSHEGGEDALSRRGSSRPCLPFY